MNALTHNGKFTIISPKTGDHRIFEIKTQSEKAKFAPKARILSVKETEGHEIKWIRFAFVTTKGISVWNSKKSPDPKDPSIYERYADLLVRQEHWEKQGVKYEMSVVCRVCNRELTDPVSLERGIGPECAKKKGY